MTRNEHYLQILTIVTVLFGLTTAQAEEPVGFLHCTGIGVRGNVEHSIAIFSQEAALDSGPRLKLIRSETFYEIEDVDVAAKIIGQISWMQINRLTGAYQIMAGSTIVLSAKIEEGICVRVQRNL